MMCCIILGGGMDENKKKLKTNLISSFLILLSCCLAVALLINLRFHEDCATVIVSMLGVCAAFYAPVAAYFLYDSWKEQKRYEIIKELMIDIATILSDVYAKIEKSAILATSLKKIENDKVILNNLINSNNLRKADDLNKIYTLINLYENITNDKDLMKYKDNFDKTSFNLLFFLSKLDPLYVKYMDTLELQLEPIYIKTTDYKEGEKDKVEKLTFEIGCYLSNSLPVEKGNDDFTFDKNKENFNDAYKEFIKEISKRLNP